ncbi:hypothetical protein BDC45DRAFT_536757 [Circinella umbellata]|nr:hypothetical protein BDC45DRAFT_536757 [Circinella umbellata]
MSNKKSFFTSNSSDNWGFIEFLRSNHKGDGELTLKKLYKHFMEFHSQLDCHQKSTEDPRLKILLGRVKRDNQFNKQQLLNCSGKAREQSLATINVNFGSNNCFQIGDSNQQIVNEIPDNSHAINQSYGSESDESDLGDLFNNNHDDIVTSRQDFRTKLFGVAYKKFYELLKY